MLANFGFQTIYFFDSAQCEPVLSHLCREYLCDKEFFSKTILACLSGAQRGSIHAKKIAKKFRDTATLYVPRSVKVKPQEIEKFNKSLTSFLFIKLQN